MAKVIFKYPIQIADDFTLDMPGGARILTVQLQNGNPYIWAIVEDTIPLLTYSFRVIGTGNPFSPDYRDRYIGTVQTGPFVWHIFEVSE